MLRLFRSILLILLFSLLAVNSHGVREFRVSNHGGAHQIWFEAEHFDERNPEGDEFFQIAGQGNAPKAPAGAFGEAMVRVPEAGGMILWNFDISKAGGKGGTWYFWARVVNPTDKSDYLLVKGDPGDKEIPKDPPFPGGLDNPPPFDEADDRILESHCADWCWWSNKDRQIAAPQYQGSTKELQDGENTMYILHRQGNETVFWDVFMWTDSPDYQATDDDYIKATSPTAVQPRAKLPLLWGRLKAE